MIPLVHDFTDQTVLVFGGGTVGERKARRFAAEARVVVVSPEFTDALADTTTVREATHETWRPSGEGPGIELVRDAPTADTVSGWVDRVDPTLVVAATDIEAVNEAAAAAAQSRQVLVNRTDRAGGRDAGSVVVPATVDDGSVSVAVTTGGASPALSKYLRERLEADLAGAGAMADLTRDLRTDLKTRDLTPGERRAAMRRVVRSSRVWKALRTGTTNARKVAEDVIRIETTNPSEREREDS
ncbi:precorrin-2 dehydrogenase/sirohydrochlorin ferrochelatase family protein [Salinigranum halophilum]|jgi:precorrin-2 dehydrogenase/sirohydrochlorin ferrochelatase|uniref:precorrin-2 dehydrogenase/sirohydrochlorin ferrochelatase family protein n=1 Tax=Salinigranum halophilum TaxID=2565931 RepID=UPI00115CA6EA|nr:bifunctional precorrin-2 dehydrogenase/sirohydrochlorin ferrochelatase [Salinigranum halophilum]